MPGEKRRNTISLIEELNSAPFRFEFFQAVRILLAHYRTNARHNDAELLGQHIRFRSSISLAFPPSQIESLEWEVHDYTEGGNSESEKFDTRKPGEYAGMRGRMQTVRMTPSIIGLTGPLGVLPRHYTQHAADQVFYFKEEATRAFLDIFTTRSVALFYQAWLRSKPFLQFEADRKTHFLPMVLSFSGIGLPGTRERLNKDDSGVSDETLAFYSAAFMQRRRSIESFARVVADYFNVSCGTEQFLGRWLPVEPCDRSTLGEANCRLGTSALCGERVWSRTAKVRLNIGPVRHSRFAEFLPGCGAEKRLRKLFHLLISPILDYEVRLALDRRDVHPVCLKSRVPAARLGWSSWLESSAGAEDKLETAYFVAADGRP